MVLREVEFYLVAFSCHIEGEAVLLGRNGNMVGAQLVDDAPVLYHPLRPHQHQVHPATTTNCTSQLAWPHTDSHMLVITLCDLWYGYQPIVR